MDIHRHCPVCRAGNASPFWRKPGLQLVRCLQCGMVFANPVESRLAGGAYYRQHGAEHQLSPDKLQSDYAPVRYERELRFFRQFCPAGDVLDVGCSTGGFLARLKNAGSYTITGLDVAETALDHAARQGVAVVREPLLDHDFGPRRFDAITFWAVLEHVVNPGEFLTRASDLLRPGGFCFVLVPNFQSLATRLLGVKYRYVMAEHVNYFTLPTLRGLAARVPALKEAAVRGLHFNPVVLWQDGRSRGEPVPEADRAGLLRRTTGWKQARWAAPLRPVYGGLERLLGALGLADNLAVAWRKSETASLPAPDAFSV